jgi:hypothetical protein
VKNINFFVLYLKFFSKGALGSALENLTQNASMMCITSHYMRVDAATGVMLSAFQPALPVVFDKQTMSLKVYGNSETEINYWQLVILYKILKKMGIKLPDNPIEQFTSGSSYTFDDKKITISNDGDRILVSSCYATFQAVNSCLSIHRLCNCS